MSLKRATIWRDGAWLYIRSPFNKNFVSDIKWQIHPSYRGWDKEKKLWTIDPSQIDVLVDIAERYYDVHVLPDMREDEAPREPYRFPVGPISSPHETMLKLAKPRTLRRIYHLIAKDVHPDQGGRHEDMVALNEAWEYLKGTEDE